MRHPALLTRDCIFVLVDVQDKLFVHIHGKEKVQRNIELLLRFARIFNIPLVVTEHYPKGLGATIPEIKVLIEGARIHEKVTFSCCGNEGF